MKAAALDVLHQGWAILRGEQAACGVVDELGMGGHHARTYPLIDGWWKVELMQNGARGCHPGPHTTDPAAER